MAFVRIVHYPGGTEAQYRAVIDALGPAHSNATGRIFLAAGATERGWQIVMVWESKEAFARWADEHIEAAHELAGERGWRSRPEFVDFTAYHVLT